jgi:hypothetical protein
VQVRGGAERYSNYHAGAFDTEDVNPLFASGQLHNLDTIDDNFGSIRATFTNGILSGQWLRPAIEADGEEFNKKSIEDAIADPNSEIRSYLTGDVLETLKLFLTEKKYAKGKLRLALYELKDKELVDILIKNKKRLEVILSNTSKSRGGKVWDATNRIARSSQEGRCQNHDGCSTATSDTINSRCGSTRRQSGHDRQHELDVDRTLRAIEQRAVMNRGAGGRIQ